MKRIKCWILLLILISGSLLAAGCTASKENQRYSRSYFEAFDTVVTLTAYTHTEDEFEHIAKMFSDRLYALDAVFDRYEPHAGVNGVYALNESGGDWLAVEPELYALLECVRTWDAAGRNRVNPALGNLFALWKEYRDVGDVLPTEAALNLAAEHGEFSTVRLQDGRVRLVDAEVRLDLGAVAKGYAAGILGEMVSEVCDVYLIDAGGNIVAGEAPPNKRNIWAVGVENPDGGDVSLVLGLENLCAVTSADSQRYFEVDGVRYHHLIDPDTRRPARFMRQATVICADSGWADYLSTLLFLTPVEDALVLAEKLEGVEAIFVRNDGTLQMTNGVEGLMID